MKGVVTAAETSLLVKTNWRSHLVAAKHTISPGSLSCLAVQRRIGISAYATNLILCLSFWMSLLAAIWLTRGWIGLLFSGQLLSAGARLLKTLSKRTHYAFSAGNGPLHELEGDRNE
jgi:hypothetical protein